MSSWSYPTLSKCLFIPAERINHNLLIDIHWSNDFSPLFGVIILTWFLHSLHMSQFHTISVSRRSRWCTSALLQLESENKSSPSEVEDPVTTTLESCLIYSTRCSSQFLNIMGLSYSITAEFSFREISCGDMSKDWHRRQMTQFIDWYWVILTHSIASYTSGKLTWLWKITIFNE